LISTGPVTAENEERCGSALYVEDASKWVKITLKMSTCSWIEVFFDSLRTDGNVAKGGTQKLPKEFKIVVHIDMTILCRLFLLILVVHPLSAPKAGLEVEESELFRRNDFHDRRKNII
jgi:hypothetical protein